MIRTIGRKRAPLKLFAYAAVFSAALCGCSNNQHAEKLAPDTVSDVSLVVVHKAAEPDWLEAVGTVRAAQISQIASQSQGTIREIHTREGDLVQAGQVLATIDDAQPRAAVDQATAGLNAADKQAAAADSELSLAESTLQRYQQLFDKKSVSPQEFDEIKSRRQTVEAHRDMARAEQAQAKAALAQAQTALGYTQIQAPFAGVVTEKKIDPGSLVSPGTPVFTIENAGNYRLEVTIDENNFRLVRAGETVPVSMDSLGNVAVSGKVAQIVPAADPASRSFLVKIALPANAHLHSGLFGTARFARGQTPALMIPRAAIVQRGQLQGVYVIDANRLAQLRYVTLGKSAGERVEALSGLQDGETIVAEPGTRELGGKQIAARP
jgi:RND family efflux transporter MFP subunit